MKKFRTLLILLVLSLVYAGCQAPAGSTPTTTAAEPTIAIEPIDKTVFVWEDFSTVKTEETSYNDLCRLIPLTKQLPMTMYSTVGYYTYPTEDGGFVRIHFTTKNDNVSAVFYYPGENSEYYPVKDLDAFTFIAPGETTFQQVMENVPHPDYRTTTDDSGMSYLDYEMADGSVVYVYFDQRSRTIHHLELEKDGIRQTME